MNMNIDTSRVASLVNDLRTTDWERKLGSWTTTLLALTVVWWLLRRVRNTVQAVNGPREMPDALPHSITQILFPLDMVIVAVFAAMAWAGAQVVWWLIGRRWRVDSFPRRLVSILVAGSVGLTTLLYLLAIPIEVYEGARIAAAVTENIDESREFLTDWVVYLPIPAVATSLVASWRRGELELTGRRRQGLAVAAAVIVVAPGVLGAVGVGVTADDSRQDSLTNTNVTAADLDDGYSGPDLEELEASDLERGAYQPASALLGCGDVDEEAFATPYLEPEYAVSSVVNVSEPGDESRPYLEVAPYRNESGDVIHGTYAYRIANSPAGNWTLLDEWTSNRVHADDSEWGDSAAGMSGAWGKSRNAGTLALENVRSATVVIDVVNPDGEIVRVQYRLCRPDVEG